MAHRRAHVPKLSDFEGGDDYSYAAHLEPRRNKDPDLRTNRNIPNKSQEKGTDMRINRKEPQKSPEKGTGIRINRNGLEKIQEKSTGMRISRNGVEKSPQKRNERGNDSFPPISVSSESTQEVERYNNHRRTNSRSLVLEFNSEKSNNDNFVQRNHGKDNKKKKSAVDSVYSPGHGSISNLSDLSQGSVSVPKFGAWDDKDPTSGDGFTVIFNKVKEEKQIAASKFPVKPSQVVTHTTARKENSKSNLKSNTGSKSCWRCWSVSE